MFNSFCYSDPRLDLYQSWGRLFFLELDDYSALSLAFIARSFRIVVFLNRSGLSIFFLLNVFTALKGVHFNMLFVVTTADVVQP